MTACANKHTIRLSNTEGVLKMNLTEMMGKVKAIYETNEENYTLIGMRFEDKKRKLNDICECSKSNAGREDEREFPSYRTKAYKNMKTLEGTCAWDLRDKEEAYRYMNKYGNETTTQAYSQKHCYIVVGNYKCSGATDDNEIIIEDAKVIAVIF